MFPRSPGDVVDNFDQLMMVRALVLNLHPLHYQLLKRVLAILARHASRASPLNPTPLTHSHPGQPASDAAETATGTPRIDRRYLARPASVKHSATLSDAKDAHADGDRDRDGDRDGDRAGGDGEKLTQPRNGPAYQHLVMGLDLGAVDEVTSLKLGHEFANFFFHLERRPRDAAFLPADPTGALRAARPLDLTLAVEFGNVSILSRCCLDYVMWTALAFFF